MAINVDFTKGSVNSFVASGGTPTYGPDGVTFTVARPGDAPQLTSVFYIMFGRVEFTMKCAPGAGIVSSLVLESDDLDEIDMEWLGADSSEVQTNYFGKGQTGSYDRGQFNPAPNNQGQFVTYTIDWTADRIVWSVGGTTVRVLNYNDARGQYPQTPMQVKFGAWSGGDASNAQGTIQWARGPTDYSKGPFSMTARSLVVTDYSTGKQYRYGDSSGTWQSIQAVDGQVNANAGKGGPAQTVTATSPAATSLSPSVPVGGIGGGGSSSPAAGSSNPIPSGWVMTSSGKIVPASSAVDHPTSSLSLAVSASPSSPASPGGEQIITTSDANGQLTTVTLTAGKTQSPNTDGDGSSPTQAPTGLAAPLQNRGALNSPPPHQLWACAALSLALILLAAAA